MIEKILQVSQDESLFSEEDKEIYEYGYSLLKETIINVTVALIIAVIMKKINIFILFSVFFIPLRTFAGGFHAKNALSCSILSNAILVGVYFINDFLKAKPIGLNYIVICVVVLGIVIGRLSPVDSSGKRLTDSEKSKYKQIVNCILLVEMIVQLCLISKRIYIVCIVFVIETISLILGMRGNIKENVF